MDAGPGGKRTVLGGAVGVRGGRDGAALDLAAARDQAGLRPVDPARHVRPKHLQAAPRMSRHTSCSSLPTQHM